MNKQDYLATLLGPERAEAYAQKMATTQEALREIGVEEKAAKPDASKVTPEAPATVVNNNVSLAMDEILKAVRADIGVEELQKFLTPLEEQAEKVTVLESLVKELLTSKEEAVAEMISPKAGFLWQQKARASQSQDNVLDENNENDKVLKKSVPVIPDEDWLSKQTGSMPLSEEVLHA